MAIPLSDLQSIPYLETYRVNDTWEVLRDRVDSENNNNNDEGIMYNSRHIIDYIHFNVIMGENGAEVKFNRKQKIYDMLRLKDELFEL